jgi:hypothetical protein
MSIKSLLQTIVDLQSQVGLVRRKPQLHKGFTTATAGKGAILTVLLAMLAAQNRDRLAVFCRSKKGLVLGACTFRLDASLTAKF